MIYKAWPDRPLKGIDQPQQQPQSYLGGIGSLHSSYDIEYM